MPLTEPQRTWYYNKIRAADPAGAIVTIDEANHMLVYSANVQTDESRHKEATPEEVVHALVMCLLVKPPFNYPLNCLYHEKYCKHGRASKDEVDLVIYDGDALPFAMWELKSAEEFEKNQEKQIESQLFGTAPLVGTPKFLVYATIEPTGAKPQINLICIDRTKSPSFSTWKKDGKPLSTSFPEDYADPSYKPYVRGGTPDLRDDCTQADFRVLAEGFHNEFFGEHPDNAIFVNLMKCLLVKIYDERQCKDGEAYKFQVLRKAGRDEPALDVFTRINDLYKIAYSRYIDAKAAEPDEIDVKEFPTERVKQVVKTIQGMAITRGAALHGDVIGAFFEEILRAGFKQDKGMYFTHDNLVNFMVEAVDLDGLTVDTWKKSNHPENRMPYVIDPSCGSGTFLLRAMHVMTNAVRSRRKQLVNDMESEAYFDARMADSRPNGWAESFLYGLDPKFIMAITAKVNMVLHGDGSAHVFKYDSLRPLTSFADDKFKPLSDPHKSISTGAYKFSVCESFDVVISNPPFGITLPSETLAALPQNYFLSSTVPSECLFLERWFQLLKPGGRLAVVVPESLLNATDNVDARIFLYRLFWLRTVVSLPRNLFIETPTLTSLLFAQKKSPKEIAQWDAAWEKARISYENKVQETRTFLKKSRYSKKLAPVDVQTEILKRLKGVIDETTAVTKKGKAPVTMKLPVAVTTAAEACNHYLDAFKLAGFSSLVRSAIFRQIAEALDYEYPVYLVSEVGYKLSKRKERIRPNQLCKFVGQKSKAESPNLHLANETVEVSINAKTPERILDYIRRDVKWA
jgi:type I restriction enzyme M protein